MQLSVPLSNLTHSKHNVRQAYDPDMVKQMWATIKARGIMQSLGVLPTRKKSHYEVHVGGLRLAALNHGLDLGEITADSEIPCMLRDKATAREDSLAENVIRFAMHPLDECVEFKRLVDSGQSVEAVAERFGTLVRHIQQRLRLATLLPEIADAYCAKRITLDQAQAFTATNDHGIQANVWQRVCDYPVRWPADAIRDAVKSHGLPATHRLVRLVGREAYEAAQGLVEDTLFPDDIVYRDRALLEQLAVAKMEATAEAFRAESPYAEVRISSTMNGVPTYDDVRDLRRIDPVAVDLSEEDQARYDSLVARYNTITDDESRDEDDLSEEERAELETVQSEINLLDEKGWAYPDDVISQAVAILVLDQDGEVVRHDELYLPKAASPEQAKAADAREDDAGHDRADAQEASDEPPARKPFAESAKLADELADQRKQILAAGIAQAPDLAYDVAIFVLVSQTIVKAATYTDDVAMQISASTASRLVFATRFDDTIANRTLLELRDHLDLAWAREPDTCSRFLAFRSLAPDAKAALLAHAIAVTIKPTIGKTRNSQHFSRFHEMLGVLMGIETAEWWRPTAANYWFRTNKDRMLELLDEFGGAELRSRYSGEKKAPLAETMERLSEGNAIVEAQIAECARAWVPSIMRFDFALPSDSSDQEEPGTAADEPAEDTPPPATSSKDRKLDEAA